MILNNNSETSVKPIIMKTKSSQMDLVHLSLLLLVVLEGIIGDLNTSLKKNAYTEDLRPG